MSLDSSTSRTRSDVTASGSCCWPMGDRGLLIYFEEVISPEVNRKVRALSQGIAAARIAGVQEIVPAYRSVLVCYDPLAIAFDDLCLRIREIETKLGELVLPRPRLFRIPVCYGGEMGPDLPYVAEYNGLTEEEVIAIHSGATYLVYMIGFLPGFPYLGGMSPRIATPRLPAPRTKIPAGSVGIAGDQTGIYPLESPGGWRIIGRTPIKLYNPDRDPPVLLTPGDFVKFFPVSRDEFEDIQGQVERSAYQVEVETVKDGN